jgi:small subunit ribosomal protein S8
MSDETVVIKKNKTSNDPVADFLTRIRNATIAKKPTVLVPFSKLKLELANLLSSEGYISSVQIVNEESVATKSLEIGIKYLNGESVIKGLKKVSKPGLRKYAKAKYSPRVLSGLGVSILTTSQGLRTDRKARKDKVGGEVLCQVW